MKTTLTSITRLLRSAASAPNEPIGEMPFGFDTRVVALWRATSELAGIASLLRRVVLIAASVIVLGSAAAYRELKQDDGFGDEFAIADSAIGVAVDR